MLVVLQGQVESALRCRSSNGCRTLAPKQIHSERDTWSPKYKVTGGEGCHTLFPLVCNIIIIISFMTIERKKKIFSHSFLIISKTPEEGGSGWLRLK